MPDHVHDLPDSFHLEGQSTFYDGNQGASSQGSASPPPVGVWSAEEDPLLTIKEVSLQLRVHSSTVRKWILNGLVEAISLPHSGTKQSYRIRRSALMALITSPSLPDEQQS
jgi:excisionase family DNA binding protein